MLNPNSDRIEMTDLNSDQENLLQKDRENAEVNKKTKKHSFSIGLGIGWAGGTLTGAGLMAAVGGLMWWNNKETNNTSAPSASTTSENLTTSATATSATTSSVTTEVITSTTSSISTTTTATTSTTDATSTTTGSSFSTTGTTGSVTTGSATSSSTSTTSISTTGSTTGNNNNCVEPFEPQTFSWRNPYGGGIEVCVVNNEDSSIQIKEWSYEANSKIAGSPWGTAAQGATITTSLNTDHSKYVSKASYTSSLTIPAHSSACLSYGYETAPELVGNEIPDAVMPPTSVSAKFNGSSTQKSLPIYNRQICATDPVPNFTRRAYYTNWSMYGAQYPVTSVPIPTVNEISYFAFLIDTATGKLKSTDTYADSLQLPKLDIMKQQFPNLFKTSVTIGGWNTHSMFDTVAADSTLTMNFANSLKNLLVQTRMKSVIIDWEWSAAENFDTDRFVNFFTTIRNVLGSEYEIHLAAPANPALVTQIPQNKWSILSNTLNKVLIMTYDYFGWGDYSGELAPLRTDPRSPFSQSYPSNQFSVEGSVNAYKAQGIPANKLAIGGALYGRAQKVSTMGETHGVWQPWTGIYKGQFDTTGTYTAKCILKGQCGSGSGLPSDTVYVPASQNPYGNYTQQPLVYSDSEKVYVGCEDGDAIAAKVQFAKQNGISDMMYWEPSQDLNVNDSDSLMRAGFEEAQRQFGTTTNATQKSMALQYNHDFENNAASPNSSKVENQSAIQKALHELFSQFPTELFNDFCKAVAQSALFSFLPMLTEEYLTNYLKAHKWDDESIYWANQAIKILTMLLVGNVQTAVMTQALHHGLVFLGVSEKTAHEASLVASFAINAAAHGGVVPTVVTAAAVGLGTKVANVGMFAVKNIQKNIADQSAVVQLTKEDRELEKVRLQQMQCV